MEAKILICPSQAIYHLKSSDREAWKYMSIKLRSLTSVTIFKLVLIFWSPTNIGFDKSGINVTIWLQSGGRLNQMTQMEQTASDKIILGVISCILKGIPHGSKWGQNQDFEKGAHWLERFFGWFLITSEGSLNMSEYISMDFGQSWSSFIWVSCEKAWIWRSGNRVLTEIGSLSTALLVD